MKASEVKPCEGCGKHRFDCAHVECPRRVRWQKDFKQGRQGPVEPKLQEERGRPLA